VDKVAKALTDRPALTMTVVGQAQLEREREGWKQAQLQGMLLAQKRRAARRDGQDPGDVAPVAPEEVPALLKEVYRRADIPKPRNFIGLAKDLPQSEMEALLLASIPVPENAMRELAVARGVAVRDYLAQHQVPKDACSSGPWIPSRMTPNGRPGHNSPWPCRRAFGNRSKYRRKYAFHPGPLKALAGVVPFKSSMFPFSSRSKMSDAPEVNPAPAKTPEPHPLDALTGGAFSAATSGERAARVRDWLATQPSSEQLQEVFKELSVRDKGAARAIRERIDEIKRAKGQEAIAAEWAEKAQGLLAAPRLNIADAMAWQRDAAKAGAPLSREPLSLLKTQLAERVKVIEDLQHRVQVQREAAVLLAQRIEVLSTKSWLDAQAALELLRTDVGRWQEQAAELTGDASWASVEARFPPLLDASRTQLLVVWDAFQSALAQTAAAAQDAAAPLPPVPVWADELRVARGLPTEAAATAAAAEAKQPKPKTDPAVVEKAEQAVREALAKLEKETAEGHGKASVGAAGALRAVLKVQGRHIGAELEQQVHQALVAAGELQGWQRWSADQVREELVAKAEALLLRPEDRRWAGARCRKPCASCASSGSRRTKVGRPTTRCGASSMKPATPHTRWSKPGSTRFAPSPPSTRPSALR